MTRSVRFRAEPVQCSGAGCVSRACTRDGAAPAYVRRMLVNEFLLLRRKWARVGPTGEIELINDRPDHATIHADRQARWPLPWPDGVGNTTRLPRPPAGRPRRGR